MSKDNIEILYEVYAASGLGKWFAQDWKDISRKKKGGGHPSCGASAGKGVRKKSKSKKYPKCVSASRAAGMSKKEKASAVRRKRAAGNKGKKPNWVSTKPKKEVFIATENNMKIDELLDFLTEESKPSKKLVKENNIVETIRAMVLEELYKENAPTEDTKGTGTPPVAAAGQAAPTPSDASTAPAASNAGTPPPAAQAAGQVPPAPATPVKEMKSLEEDLDEAFGLEEDSYSPFPPKEDGKEKEDEVPDPMGLGSDSRRPTQEAFGDSGAGTSFVSPVAEIEENCSRFFAESKVVRGRVLSESTKNGELLMQERRRKQLIQVQNKILYSKR